MIKAEGLQAVGESFQELGSITGEEILKTPEIKQQLNGVVKYIDLNKLVVTFLTPDLWNKLGVVRGEWSLLFELQIIKLKQVYWYKYAYR